MMAALVGMPSALAGDAPSLLTGDGRGHWTVKPNNVPDTGTVRRLHGHGHFSIGKAKIRGTITEPGFVAEGYCSVAIRLVTNTGAIKVVGHSKKEGRDTLNCNGAPIQFHFHTTKAKGDLAGTKYRGVGVYDVEDSSTDTEADQTFTLMLRVRRD